MGTRHDASRAVGSVRPERGRRDRWRIQVSLGTDSTGRRRRITRIVDGDRAEADRRLAQLIVETQAGSLEADPRRLTFERYLVDQWLPAKAGRAREKTLEEYSGIIGRYITPRALGRARLDRVTPLAVERWVAELRRDDLGEGVIRNAFAVVRGSLRQAVRWRIIPADPTAAVEGKPRPDKYEALTLTVDQLPAFLEAFEGDPIEAAVVLALGAGLRRGEALGARWEDVDLEGRVVRVERSVTQLKGKGRTVTPPKTRKSRREVPVPAWVVEKLRRIRKVQLEQRMRSSSWRETGLIVTTRNGTGVLPSEVTRRYREIRDAAGLPKARFHDLRHAYASIALSAGIDLGIVSDLLGHSTIVITKDLYARASLDARQVAVDRAFGGLIG